MALREHQVKALNSMKNGCILCGGVGTGKSRTALAYYQKHHMGDPVLVVTTAKKRDSLEWEGEFLEMGLAGVERVVDSWNNIKKHQDKRGWFIIFDEQRVVGSGAWVKAFLKMAKVNSWVLLSATPGDVWMDYAPVFIANGFYKNKTEFTQQHVVYNNYGGFPTIDRYVGTRKLERLRQDVLVFMPFERSTTRHEVVLQVPYDEKKTRELLKTRWNPYKDDLVGNAGELCYVMRRITNEEPKRLEHVVDIAKKHGRLIVYYNFDYELRLLRSMQKLLPKHKFAEWNGHKHEPVPGGIHWVYLVQYTAGAEAWNCVTTNAMAFYSQTYSYKTDEQCQGRIDRLNTPYTDLYYYRIRSNSKIDLAIKRALTNKKRFNEKAFVAKLG